MFRDRKKNLKRLEELEDKIVDMDYELDYKIDELENKIDDIDWRLELLNDKLNLLLDNDIFK